jgi:pectinesterase
MTARFKILLIICVLSALGPVTTNVATAQTNIVVAADGSGQFKTVQDAINAVPQTTRFDNPAIIHIKPGVYKELIYVQHEKRFVRLVGEDPLRTVLTYNLHANMIGADGKPIGTFRTPSTFIDADDFTVENITFENTAGPVGQALAIRVEGDRVVFRNCRFLGWQDTILINRGRQYFENCYISGHVDFIFGAATAFFENCHIHILRDGYITAASTPPQQPFGFVFSHCKITGESPTIKTYLGRPWRPFASTIFLNTEMSEIIRPEGWHNWNQTDREQTSRYAEFASTGAGAKPNERVKWAKLLTDAEAKTITLQRVLAGADNWNPKTGTALFTNMNEAVQAPIVLWPDGAPGAAGNEAVDIPTLTPFLPLKEKATGAAIIVCPGGGYSHLADHEGAPVAQWLNSIGITAFVLKYRLGARYHHPAPLQDAARALRIVRSRAAEWKLDRERVGILGFSAGGHLAATLATHFDSGQANAPDPIERLSSRPALAILIYPVITMRDKTHAGSKKSLLGDNPPAELVTLLSNEEQVTKDTPPTFLVHTMTDTAVPVENSLMFVAALRKAGVPLEFHLYERGPHGFGLGRDDPILSTWPARCADWLRVHGFAQ